MKMFREKHLRIVISMVIVLVTILFAIQISPNDNQELKAEGTAIINDGPSGAKIVDIKVGATSSPAYYALTDDGYIYAWGACNSGQLGNGIASNSSVNTPQKVLNASNLQSQGEYLSDIERIYVFSENSSSSVFAVKKNGDLYAWGRNVYGRLGLSWGEDYYSIPTKIPVNFKIKDIKGFQNRTAILTTSNEIYVSGYGAAGEIGINMDGLYLDKFTKLTLDEDGNRLPLMKDISLGEKHFMAISINDELYGSGNSWYLGFSGFSSGTKYTLAKLTPPDEMKNLHFITNSCYYHEIIATDNGLYFNNKSDAKFTKISNYSYFSDYNSVFENMIYADWSAYGSTFISQDHKIYYLERNSQPYEPDLASNYLTVKPYSKGEITSSYSNAKAVISASRNINTLVLSNNGGVYLNGSKVTFGSITLDALDSNNQSYYSANKGNKAISITIDTTDNSLNSVVYDETDLLTNEKSKIEEVSPSKIDITLNEGNRVYKKYEFYKTDAKAETVVTFIVDLYKNPFTLSDIIDNESYDLGHSFTIPTYNGFAENTVSATLSKDGGKAVSYLSEEPINETGSYVLTATDLYGNTCSYTFSIVDTPTPVSFVFTPTTDGELIYGNTITKQNQILGSLSMSYSDGTDTTHFTSLSLEESETRFEITDQNKIKVIGSDLAAGEYSLKVTAEDLNGLTLTETITFTIQKATQMMDWNSESKALTEISYGDDVTLGIDNAVGDVTYDLKDTNTCVSISNTGVVGITCIPESKVTFIATASGNENYESKIIELSVSIVKGNQTMKWDETSASLETNGLYVGKEVTLGVSNQPSGTTMTYGLKASNSCITLDSTTGKVKATCVPTPASVTFTATPSGNDNYNLSPLELTVPIKKQSATLTIELLDSNSTYKNDVSIKIGDSLPTPRITSTDPSLDVSTLGTPTYTYKKNNVEVSNPSIEEGVYTVSAAYPSGSSAENYDITWNTATLRVEGITIDENNQGDYFTLTSNGKPYTPGTWTNKDIIITPVHDTFNQMSVDEAENKITNAYTYNVDGSKKVNLSFYNSEGAKVSTTVTLNYDKTAPVVSQFNYEDETSLRSMLRAVTFDHFFGKAQQVSFTGSDETDGSGLDHYRYEIVELDDAKNEKPASKKTGTLGLNDKLNLSINTSYRISAWAVDTAGNESDEKIERVFLNDEVAQLNITATSDGKPYDGSKWTKSGVTVKLSSTSNAGVEKYQYSSDGVVFHDITGDTITLPDPLANVDDVTYTFRAINSDHTESDKTLNLKVDTVKPEINITGKVNDSAYDGSLVDQNIELTMNQTNTNISGATYYYTTSPTSKDTDPTTDSNWKRYTTPMTHSANGTFTYYFKAISNAGICSEPEEYTVKLAKKEYTNITVNVTSEGKTYSPGNWTKGDVTFTLNGGLKDESQITGYEYTTTSGNTPSSSATWKPVTNKKLILTESIKDQTYWFRVTPVDSDGKISTGTKVNLDVDVPTVPTMKLDEVNNTRVAQLINLFSFGNWMNKQAKVTMTSSDITSGIDYYEYVETINGTDSKPKSSEGTVTYEDEIELTLKARACDKAGNCSAYTNAEAIKIDMKAPSITGVKDQSEYKQYYLPRFVTITDSVSGLKQATYKKNNTPAGTFTDNKEIEIKGEGSYEIYAVDEAGNEVTLTFKIVKLPNIKTEIDGSDETKEIIDQIKHEYQEVKDKIDKLEQTEYTKWIEEASAIWREQRTNVIETEDKSAKIEGTGDITFDSAAKLIIEELTEKELPVLPNKAKYGYGVYLKKEETTLQPSGEIKVFLPYDGIDEVVVYAIDEDNTFSELSVQVEQGYVTFLTDRLMKYAISYKTKEDIPNTICVVGPDLLPNTKDDVCVKGDENFTPNKESDGSITVPNGGTIVFPNGNELSVPNGGIIKPDGTVCLPDGTNYNSNGDLINQNEQLDDPNETETVSQLNAQGFIVEAIDGSFNAKDVLHIELITEEIQEELDKVYPSTYKVVKGYELQYIHNGVVTVLNQTVKVTIPKQIDQNIELLAIQQDHHTWSFVEPVNLKEAYTYETDSLGKVGLMNNVVMTKQTEQKTNTASNVSRASTGDETNILRNMITFCLPVLFVIMGKIRKRNHI